MVPEIAHVRILKRRDGTSQVIMPLPAFLRLLARLEDQHDAAVARRRMSLKGIPYRKARRRISLAEH